ncbi:MAG: transcriptional regulator MntR [Pedosphaera sp.]|nr:transcriptional regulator MntR [Pedosphaera sp.]
MKTDALPSTSTEDYLERIHELIEEKGYARAVDIAEALKISQPSVTAMVQKLADAGYLNYQKYRGLTLTQKGRAVAGNIRARHQTLERFFTLLDLPLETRERDIEGIEHCLSPVTLSSLARLADFFEANPRILRELTAFKKRPASRRVNPPAGR